MYRHRNGNRCGRGILGYHVNRRGLERSRDGDRLEQSDNTKHQAEPVLGLCLQCRSHSGGCRRSFPVLRDPPEPDRGRRGHGHFIGDRRLERPQAAKV